MRRIIFTLLVFTTVSHGLLAQTKSVEAGSAMRTQNNGTYLGTFQPKEGDVELMPEFKVIRNKINKSQNQEELAKYKDSLRVLKRAAGLISEQSSNKTTGSIDPRNVFGFNA